MLSARVLLLFLVSFLLAAAGDAAAQTPPSQKAAPQTRAQNFTNEACPRPAPSSLIPEPEDLRSKNRVLRVQVLRSTTNSTRAGTSAIATSSAMACSLPICVSVPATY